MTYPAPYTELHLYGTRSTYIYNGITFIYFFYRKCENGLIICICKWAVMNAGTVHCWAVMDSWWSNTIQTEKQIKQLSSDMRQAGCGSVGRVGLLVCVCAVHTSSCLHIKRRPVCVCASRRLLPLTAVCGSHHSSTTTHPLTHANKSYTW